MKSQPAGRPAAPEAPRTGPAVRLRALEPGDLGRALLWVNDPEITRFTGTLFPISSVEEDEWYRRMLHDPTQRAFALETDGGRHVGNAGFRDIQSVPRKAELWIYVGDKSKQNAGLGTAAIHELVKFGFERMNLHRVWVRVFSYNERALKAFQRCGFMPEGVLVDDVWRDGRYHDTHVLAIVRNP
ncbi:MAG: GNAT family N-acetyltransferase [Candidatus Eisenbacteria bacterium]|nr:GNAT family N-acetyltransferase [Candidatus Eisenbacteria bacterium]